MVDKPLWWRDDTGSLLLMMVCYLQEDTDEIHSDRFRNVQGSEIVEDT